jgi:2-oxoglutarate ferredoxin oxidoreductase subunit beta
MEAMIRLESARSNDELITGLVYFDDSRGSLAEVSQLGNTPLSALPEEKLRPAPEILDRIMNDLM